MDANGAAWVQAISGGVQAIFAIVLFFATVVTIRLTRRTADETGKAAAATRDAVVEASRAREQAREQHTAAMVESERQSLDAVRPIILFEMTPDSGGNRPSIYGFAFNARNIGGGPALNVRIDFALALRTYRWDGYAQQPEVPAIVVAGERVRYQIVLDSDTPLPARPIPRLGILTASYDDLYGRPFSTTVALNPIDLNEVAGDGLRFVGVDFGPATLAQPN